MVRYARTAGLAARCLKLAWTRLAGGPLPAIAVLRNGSFLLLGKVTGDMAIVLAPHAERPTLMTRDQFEAVWDGRLISVKKRGALASQVEQSREAAVRQLQQLWKTSLTRANDISRSLIDGGRNIIKPDAEKETPSSAAMASAGIIVFADHARKLGRAVARIRPDEERRRHDEIAFLPAALEIVETPPSPLGRATAFSIIAVFAVAVDLGLSGHRRHRRDCPGQAYSKRPYQDDPAVRDRGRALDQGSRRTGWSKAATC